jgi:D-alanine-D-alanine ligase
MLVGLICNPKARLPPSQRSPPDLEAEYQGDREIEALLDAIRANGHEVALLPCDLELISALHEHPIDIAFNIAEGWGGRGRESFVPALLDMMDIPYTGSDAVTLGVTMDKALSKTIALAHRVATPPFVRVDSEDALASVKLPFPLFVKPNCEGSSMGIGESALAQDQPGLQRAAAQILRRYREPALVERFMPGREFTVGVVGNGQNLRVLPIMETVLPDGTLYNAYDIKIDHGRGVRCPADIPEELAEELRGMAVTVFEALECRDLARLDFREDDQGRPHFLEINALPGLHPEGSSFPLQAYAAGLSFAELIGAVIEAALQRYRPG